MKPIPVILLCLMLSACASQQIKPTILPEVTFTYEAQMTDEQKASLSTTILNAMSCNLPDITINITIKEYNDPGMIEQFNAMYPLVKGIYILAYVTILTPDKDPYSFNINGRITYGGILSLLIADIHDAEKSIAYKIWKKTCGIYKKGTTQNTP